MTTTIMDYSAMRMRRLLETLPQELWDQIYEQMFTATSGVRNLGCSKPERRSNLFKFKGDPTPKLLAVDRASREQFAESYYTNSTFVIYGNMSLEQWLSSLPAHHLQLIKHIRVAQELGNPMHVGRMGLLSNRYKWQVMWNYFDRDYRPIFGDQCIDAVKSGYEYEVTADLPEFVPVPRTKPSRVQPSNRGVSETESSPQAQKGSKELIFPGYTVLRLSPSVASRIERRHGWLPLKGIEMDD